MLPVLQAVLILLLADVPRFIAGTSADNAETPEQLVQDSVDIGALYPSSELFPLSLNAVIQQNGTSKRTEVPVLCYGMSFPEFLFHLSLMRLIPLNSR